jgi:hypothetical protein
MHRVFSKEPRPHHPTPGEMLDAGRLPRDFRQDNTNGETMARPLPFFVFASQDGILDWGVQVLVERDVGLLLLVASRRECSCSALLVLRYFAIRFFQREERSDDLCSCFFSCSSNAGFLKPD